MLGPVNRRRVFVDQVRAALRVKSDFVAWVYRRAGFTAPARVACSHNFTF
jgi:hypothetical protein